MEPDTRILKIASFSFGGDGVASLPDGRVCFVRGGIPGDVVEAEIHTLKKNFARAAVRSFLEKSDRRKPSFCPLREQSPRCPGCVYAETDADFELETKQRQYEDFLTRGRPAAKECRFEPPFPSPERTGYRSRLSLSCEAGRAGYRADDNRTLIPVRCCPLARPEINDVLAKLEIPPDAKRLRIRWTEKDGTVVRFGREGKSSPCPKTDLLTEDLGEYGIFLTPPDSFFQVNMPVAKALIGSVLRHIEKRRPQYLFDLFCGSGFFSAAALRRFPDLRIEGVELDPDAVRAAKINISRLAASESQARFHCLDAAKFDPKRTDAKPETTLVLLDPPRTGIPQELADTLKHWSPSAIVYVSCAPDMLRRDIERLGSGYAAREGRMFDMFPGTAHFESITLLEKV